MKKFYGGMVAVGARLLGMTGQVSANESAVAASAMTPATNAAAVEAPKLHAALRALWQGHVQHTREYAVAVHAHRASDANAAADAVVANAKQIANAVGSFYGGAADAQMLTRSEEHTSELQSLMRISYAVFCLKKKITPTPQESQH